MRIKSNQLLRALTPRAVSKLAVFALASAIPSLSSPILFVEPSFCMAAIEDVNPPRNPLATPDLAQVEREAGLCLTASDAVTVYRLFLSHAGIPDEVRRHAEDQLKIWQEREKKGLVRVGNEWISKDERAEKVAEEANLINEGLALLKLGHIRMAETEWTKASAINPQSGRAELLLGLLECQRKDHLSGLRHFQEAARREPNNYVACNNAAVAGFYARRTTQIAGDFRSALDRAGPGAAQEVADNIARILRTNKLNSRHSDEVKELYRLAIRDLHVNTFDPENDGNPPRFLLPPTWEENAPDGMDEGHFGVSADEIVYTGSGTGFVAAPGFVLTNCHVVADAVEVAIMNPADRKVFLIAEVASVDARLDLALLKCPDLAAPPIRVRRNLPGRGSELMSLGYPQTGVLGLGLKTTKGAVISVPEGSEAEFLHDAIVNRGNSGGPLVDNTGSLIGVTKAYINVENAYFVGIPVEAVWQFIGSVGPEMVMTAADDVAQLDWPAVDALVSKSTVFVKCKFKAEKGALK